MREDPLSPQEALLHLRRPPFRSLFHWVSPKRRQVLPHFSVHPGSSKESLQARNVQTVKQKAERLVFFLWAASKINGHWESPPQRNGQHERSQSEWVILGSEQHGSAKGAVTESEVGEAAEGYSRDIAEGVARAQWGEWVGAGEPNTESTDIADW